jgi:uncharacterized membrane protein
MEIIHQWIRFFHLLAAVTWIGGFIFIAVIASSLRGVDPEKRREMIGMMGRRFRGLSWIAISLLIVTGVGNLAFLGAFEDFPAFLSAHPLVLGKLILAGLMITLSALHDFVLGPRATADHPKESNRPRYVSAWVGRINLLLGLAVLFLAVKIANS